MSNDTDILSLLKNTGLTLFEINSIDTLTDSFIEYADNIHSNNIDIGFPLLNESIRGLRTQELLTLVASTGIGKSALALNFLLNFVKTTNELTILFSLEMSEIGIAERIFQIEFDLFGCEVEYNFIKKDKAFIENCRNLKNNSLNNLVIVNKRVDIASIPGVVKAIEAIKGKKAKLICIDYVGLMKNKLFEANEYLRITDNMTKLYSYAKELNVAIINLSQTSRADVKSNTNLNLFSGKGSGEVENSSDFYLTLEKIIETSNSDEQEKLNSIKSNYAELDLMKLTIHKNRRGRKNIIYATFNRKNLQINEFKN